MASTVGFSSVEEDSYAIESSIIEPLEGFRGGGNDEDASDLRIEIFDSFDLRAAIAAGGLPVIFELV